MAKRETRLEKGEEAIGANFAEYIPEDCGKLNHALNEGQPVMRHARHSAVSRRLSKLADLLMVSRPNS